MLLPEECWCAHLVLHYSLNECLQSCRISQLPSAWHVIWWGDLGGHSCSVIGEIMAVMLVCTVVYSRDWSGTSPTGGCVGSLGCAKEFSKTESVYAGISRLVYTQALWGHLTSLLGSVSICSLKEGRTLPSPICSKGIHTPCLETEFLLRTSRGTAPSHCCSPFCFSQIWISRPNLGSENEIEMDITCEQILDLQAPIVINVA